MKHQVPHDLGQAVAKQAAIAAIEGYRTRFAKYSPSANWVSDNRADIAFTAKGITLKGSITVNPSSLDLELDVPFLLKPFSKAAVPIIENEIKRQIAEAKAGAR
jgi:putative polyhydroxyalkanoic acid system protein